MKFRIISTLILFVVLGLAYIVFEANQTQAPPSQNDGIVLH